MGWPRAHFSWSALRCLGRAQFYLSLLGLLFSLSLLGWAWSLKIQLGDHMDVAQPGDGYLWPATVVVVVVFVLPVHLTAIALRPAICRDLESKRALRMSRDAGKSMDRLLFLHVLLSCLSGILVFGICAGSVFYWSNVRRRLKQGLLKALRRYPTDRDIRHGVDRLQMELHCCGVDSYRDWFYLPWAPDGGDYYEEKPGPPVSGDVPYSCCLVDILRECVHRELLTSGRSEPTISRLGCHVKILGRADDAGRDVMACLIFLTVYQLTLSILSRLLQTARWSALSHETCGEPQYEAWLFGIKGQLAPAARYSELRMLRPVNDQVCKQRYNREK
ncbi:RDS/peripherin-like protein xRDS35 [Trichogramma pretiosum]|uniref:RDS/peripherin-like protein xRDS35 n=1 Tax=Trichogramma pretiosum TaxID=7493 RepID=UPI000C71ADB2|nr:RDS/peripherin-like protein xRDS35 [Trichogramma pretiosum]